MPPKINPLFTIILNFHIPFSSACLVPYFFYRFLYFLFVFLPFLPFPTYTVKRVDGKLRPPDWMTQYSSIRGMEHFSDMQIELIRRFPTIKTKYFDAQGYSAEFFYCFPLSRDGVYDNFPSTFRRMNQNQKLHHRGSIQRPLWLQPTTHR